MYLLEDINDPLPFFVLMQTTRPSVKYFESLLFFELLAGLLLVVGNRFFRCTHYLLFYGGGVILAQVKPARNIDELLYIPLRSAPRLSKTTSQLGGTGQATLLVVPYLEAVA
jgi:hypothetical protein